MRRSFVIPTLVVFLGVFFISAGLGLRSINDIILAIGFILGVISFSLAGYLSTILLKIEENSKEND